MRLPLLQCAVLALCAPSSAQAAHQVGRTDTVLVNTSGAGTPQLAARICYPATVAGIDTPVLAQAGGWPVIVFLHGFGLLGRDYGTLGDAWASAGFVVVLLDTAQWNFVDQWRDGVAAFDALRIANDQGADWVLGNSLDLQRAAVAGHSMGGGTTGYVLAANPGYRCGLALAPADPGPNVAGLVTSPFGVVVGTGDLVTPPAWFAEPYFEYVASQQGLKFLYKLDNTCDHLNVAGLVASQPAVQARVVDVSVAFFRHFLCDDGHALDRCVGPIALAEPRLVALRQRILEPRVWAAGALRRGRSVRISLAAEEGPGGVLVANATAAPTLTPIGALLLDPATAFVWRVGAVPRSCRLDLQLAVPNLPAVVGLPIALQAAGATPSHSLQLGGAAQFTIGP